MKTFNEWIGKRKTKAIEEITPTKVYLKLPIRAEKAYKTEGNPRFSSEHKQINPRKPDGWRIRSVKGIKEAIKLLVDAGNDPSKLEYEESVGGDFNLIYYEDKYIACYDHNLKVLSLKEEFFKE